MGHIDYKQEEHWNTGTHALGILLGVIGAVYLIGQSDRMDTISRMAVWIYSFSILLLFTASTAYHWVADPRIKRRLRILDHISIYYLIAGTYTPVALITLRDGNGWILFWVIWGMALFGTVLKLFFTGRFEIFSLLLYLIMGWLIVIDLSSLLQQLSPEGTFWLGLGGAFYTLGIFFYAIRRIPFNHMIWHFFVLGGAISHWFLILGLIRAA
ncbi:MULTISPECIES: PAQR family membrane homeostasis protein TrhA [Robiginitalea]|uniref:Probable hemolysin III n=1 Tax=Robiginitalea biformata (strain ATCC BAA-864 / DSM 15991 / KCTC 12146 / HTCC2501) TaxID=313596 RepID=A4CLY8_ROBBH|nr:MULTISPECIES: hemolysin III family protein [Robiginitalea]EAR15887.1 probable hemolysin III [Robiginitalea biformata HTCC2501]MDC6354308.1 hemolysin III family protein [Robiginitalea sp. PM2]MDC6374575.1 hemolysin III family protein [Robiginitalea sp. SP8]